MLKKNTSDGDRQVGNNPNNVIPFPLPQPEKGEDTQLCRDVYLRKILQPYEEIYQKTKSTHDELISKKAETIIETNVDNLSDEIFTDFSTRRLESLYLASKLKQSVVHFIEHKRTQSVLKAMRISIINRENDYTELVKKTAVHLEFLKTIKKLKVLKSQFRVDISSLPFHMFSWSTSDYEFRCSLHDLLHVDLLEIEVNSEEIENLKFVVDVTELIKIIQALSNHYVQENKIDSKVFETLIDARNCIDYLGGLIKPINKLKKTKNDLVSEYFDKRFFQDSDKKYSLAETQTILEDITPVELRYQINWYKNVTQHKIFKEELTLKSIQNEINEIETNMKLDTYSYRSILNAHYSAIEEYRSRYERLSIQFDIDLENAENEVNITRNLVQKAHSQINYIKDQIEMFKQKVAETLELIKKQEEEKERLLQQKIKDDLQASKHEEKPKKLRKTAKK